MCSIKFISFSSIDTELGLRICGDFLRESITGLPVVAVQGIITVEEDEFWIGRRVSGHFCLESTCSATGSSATPCRGALGVAPADGWLTPEARTEP